MTIKDLEAMHADLRLDILDGIEEVQEEVDQLRADLRFEEENERGFGCSSSPKIKSMRKALIGLGSKEKQLQQMLLDLDALFDRVLGYLIRANQITDKIN